MPPQTPPFPGYTAFAGTSRIAAGTLPEVATRARQHMEFGGAAALAVFADVDGKPVDLDLRGSVADVLARLTQIESKYPLEHAETAPDPAPRGPGRPKLGVVAREVTLLPRHWDWLAGQPGGASVALRKLVEAARKHAGEVDGVRRAREVAYNFMAAMAGNLPGFEEATRALFAGDAARFEACMRQWPVDVREYAGRLAAGAFPAGQAAPAA